MIITNLFGRLGNSLFEIAIGLYLSKQLGVDFAVKLRIKRDKKIADYANLTSSTDEDDYNKKMEQYYPVEIFPHEFFKNFICLDADYDVSKYKYIGNINKYLSYKDFPIQDNLLINDWFISQDYIHYETIKDIYVPSKELKEEIFDLYNPTRNTLSINIRRGDFLNPYFIKQGWHSEPKEYWEEAIKFLNKKYDKILITSDDPEWCRNSLNSYDNIEIVDKPVENSKIFFDLFLPTFVGDNIISASTFGWWGAYLNTNPNKRVIMPYPWSTTNPLSGKRYYSKNTIKFDIYKHKQIL